MQTEPTARNILVFLPKPTANVIVARLAGYGYPAIAVSTVPELFDALRSDEYTFAVTTRPDITLLRSIRPVPVINMEIFFHGDPSGGASKRFDGKAFMERVEFLSRSASARLNFPVHEETSSRQHHNSRTSRWWLRALNLLRPANRSGTVPDARA